VVGPYRDLPYSEGPDRRRPTTTANLALRGGRASVLTAHRASRRSGVARSTLGQSRALRWWLSRTPWADVPVYTAVLTAVSSSRGLFAASRPPLVIGGLWLGPLNALPAWLASGDSLDPTDCAVLAYFLATELALA
jgi:hypothetical protein